MEKTFIAACRETFGYPEGGGRMEFSAELKQLTAQDREDLKVEFGKIGIEITEVK
jgi:hypothetical protein